MRCPSPSSPSRNVAPPPPFTHAHLFSLFPQALVQVYRRGLVGLDFIKLHYLDHLLQLERLHGTAALLTIDEAERSHKFIHTLFSRPPFFSWKISRRRTWR